ncbi:hypothetical protein ACFE04_007397 [Oxalis oulophora]
MGKGNWFKAMICLGHGSKQVQVHSTIQKPNGKNDTDQIESSSNGNVDIKEAAVIKIQRAYRRSMARKRLHRFKGATKFYDLIKGGNVKKQTSTTLGHIHSWCKIQSEISARRLHMVTEGRARQKKTENQLKLEAKLQDVEVEWNCGSETMEEILSRIQQREEAAIKRERAMAYAFSHQLRFHGPWRFLIRKGTFSLEWKANNTQYLGQAYYTIGKDKWGWSWKERWIAARPWEVRIHAQPRNTKMDHHSRQGSKSDYKVTAKQLELKLPASIKPCLSNGKVLTKKRNKLANPSHESPNNEDPSASTKPKEVS